MAEISTLQLKAHIEEVIQTMVKLPPEKVVELQDFARFLKERYGKDHAIDYSTEWTDEDLRDFTAACCDYANETMPWDESDAEQPKT